MDASLKSRERWAGTRNKTNALRDIRGAFTRYYREFRYVVQFATPLAIRCRNVVGDEIVVSVREPDLDMFIDAGLLYSTSPRGGY